MRSVLDVPCGSKMSDHDLWVRLRVFVPERCLESGSMFMRREQQHQVSAGVSTTLIAVELTLWLVW
jgi:hypothetical protein